MHRTHNPKVEGSIPSRRTIFLFLFVETSFRKMTARKDEKFRWVKFRPSVRNMDSGGKGRRWRKREDTQCPVALTRRDANAGIPSVKVYSTRCKSLSIHQIWLYKELIQYANKTQPIVSALLCIMGGQYGSKENYPCSLILHDDICGLPIRIADIEEVRVIECIMGWMYGERIDR